jgi:Fe-S cluster assembly ATP-binding protein
MLTIKNLHVSVGDKKILQGVNLTIKPGETHAVMGPNGSGKSTLAYAIMGHPSYEILNSKFQNPNKLQKSKSQLMLDGKDLVGLEADKRAKRGLFLAFQSPISIPGVSVGKFLRHIYKLQRTSKNNKTKALDIAGAVAVNKLLDKYAEKLHIKKELLSRSLNDNFSGGEKKKIETIQMLFLKPKYIIIDEIDTGLDVDSLRIVAGAIAQLKDLNAGVLIITHYNRILHFVKPDHVHIMMNGAIVKSGDAHLAQEIEKKGYQHINSKS